MRDERSWWKFTMEETGLWSPEHFRVGLSRASAVLESLQAEGQRASLIALWASSSTVHFHQQPHLPEFHSVLRSALGPDKSENKCNHQSRKTFILVGLKVVNLFSSPRTHLRNKVDKTFWNQNDTIVVTKFSTFADNIYHVVGDILQSLLLGGHLQKGISRSKLSKI